MKEIFSEISRIFNEVKEEFDKTGAEEEAEEEFEEFEDDGENSKEEHEEESSEKEADPNSSIAYKMVMYAKKEYEEEHKTPIGPEAYYCNYNGPEDDYELVLVPLGSAVRFLRLVYDNLKVEYYKKLQKTLIVVCSILVLACAFSASIANNSKREMQQSDEITSEENTVEVNDTAEVEAEVIPDETEETEVEAENTNLKEEVSSNAEAKDEAIKAAEIEKDSETTTSADKPEDKKSELRKAVFEETDSNNESSKETVIPESIELRQEEFSEGVSAAVKLYELRSVMISYYRGSYLTEEEMTEYVASYIQLVCTVNADKDLTDEIIGNYNKSIKDIPLVDYENYQLKSSEGFKEGMEQAIKLFDYNAMVEFFHDNGKISDEAYNTYREIGDDISDKAMNGSASEDEIQKVIDAGNRIISSVGDPKEIMEKGEWRNFKLISDFK